MHVYYIISIYCGNNLEIEVASRSRENNELTDFLINSTRIDTVKLSVHTFNIKTVKMENCDILLRYSSNGIVH